MPLRKIFEDCHSLYVRFDCRLYRPSEKSIFIEKEYIQAYRQESYSTVKLMNKKGDIETWQDHGPFKYDNQKYIKTELIWRK